VNKKVTKLVEQRKRNIDTRLRRRQWEHQVSPELKSSNIHYEINGRHQGHLSEGIASETEQEIRRGLKLIGESLSLDHIVFFKIANNVHKIEPIQSYSAPGSKSLDIARLPWFIERIKKEEISTLWRFPDDLPEDAVFDREYCVDSGITSALSLPLKIEGEIWGAITFISRKVCQFWPDRLIEQVNSLGEIVAGVREDKTRFHQLQEFEHLLSEISAKYINLPVNEIEKAARNDFSRLAVFLGGDRCFLCLYDQHDPNWIFQKEAIKNAFNWENPDAMGNLAEIAEIMDYPDLCGALEYPFNLTRKGMVWQFSHLDEFPPEAERTRQFMSFAGIKSSIAVPITIGGSVVGTLVVNTTRAHRMWPDHIVPQMRLIGEVFANALARKHSEESLREALLEVKHLKDQLEADYMYLKEEIDVDHGFGEIVGNSRALKNILLKVKQVAPMETTVLLLGETGTGKGMIARAIHNASKHKGRPLISVNCGALAPTLIESELFGHEKGAFTGAQAKKIGRFELARGTTLFLDEIGELSFDLQVKLLRVLQEGEFERVGGTTTLRTNARIIAATNKNIEKEIETGGFRRDLWYRLNIFPIHIPPLRDRIEDVPLFINFFVNKYGTQMGKSFEVIPQEAIKALQAYSWPGNIRELENTIERAVIVSPNGYLRVELPKEHMGIRQTRYLTLEDAEREHIIRVLLETSWRVVGLGGAARRLNINPSTLRSRMKKLGIKGYRSLRKDRPIDIPSHSFSE
jgi:transcriptional regulator with GAF, ATPase, and Fis domain